MKSVTKKLLAVLLSVLLLFGSLSCAPVSYADKAGDITEKVTYYLSFSEELLIKIKGYFMSIKYFFERITGKDVVIEAESISDFDLAKDGETVRLKKDIAYPDINISKPIDIDLNGHTLKTNSFNYSSDAKAFLTVKNGTIYATTGDIVFATPNATLELNNVTLAIVNEATQKITIDASVSTVNVVNGTKFIVIDKTKSELSAAIAAGKPAAVIIPADTRVYIAPDVTSPVCIVPAGENVEIITATAATVNVDLTNAAIKEVVITNSAAGGITPDINVTVPDDYTGLISVVNSEGSDEADVTVETDNGETFTDVAVNGTLPTPTVSYRYSADGLKSYITGLKANKAYEYKVYGTDAYTAFTGGTEIEVPANRYCVRCAAYEGYNASADAVINIPLVIDAAVTSITTSEAYTGTGYYYQGGKVTIAPTADAATIVLKNIDISDVLQSNNGADPGTIKYVDFDFDMSALSKDYVVTGVELEVDMPNYGFSQPGSYLDITLSDDFCDYLESIGLTRNTVGAKAYVAKFKDGSLGDNTFTAYLKNLYSVSDLKDLTFAEKSYLNYGNATYLSNYGENQVLEPEVEAMFYDWLYDDCIGTQFTDAAIDGKAARSAFRAVEGYHDAQPGPSEDDRIVSDWIYKAGAVSINDAIRKTDAGIAEMDNFAKGVTLKAGETTTAAGMCSYFSYEYIANILSWGSVDIDMIRSINITLVQA